MRHCSDNLCCAVPDACAHKGQDGPRDAVDRHEEPARVVQILANITAPITYSVASPEIKTFFFAPSIVLHSMLTLASVKGETRRVWLFDPLTVVVRGQTAYPGLLIPLQTRRQYFDACHRPGAGSQRRAVLACMYKKAFSHSANKTHRLVVVRIGLITRTFTVYRYKNVWHIDDSTPEKPNQQCNVCHSDGHMCCTRCKQKWYCSVRCLASDTIHDPPHCRHNMHNKRLGGNQH
jgi:hypothetical protein